MDSDMLKRSMNTVETAEYLGMAEITLKRWRGIGEGPDYFRVGLHKIRYWKVEVDKWLAAASPSE